MYAAFKDDLTDFQLATYSSKYMFMNGVKHFFKLCSIYYSDNVI